MEKRMRAANTKTKTRSVSMAASTVMAVAFLVLLCAAPARAADVMVAPGQELTLAVDIELGAADSFVAGGASSGRCKIHGAGHSIRAMDSAWSGTFSMRNCDVDGLGTATAPAIDISGGAGIDVEGCTFSTSGQIAFGLAGMMNVTFNNNTIRADSVVPAVTALSDSQAVFYGHGGSTGTLLFQGNVVLKSFLHFQSTGGWLIGGDTPAQGNILVGWRAGFLLENASAMIIRGNYSHTELGPIVNNQGWNQVKNLSFSLGSDNLVEHNIFRGLNWLTELNSGVELRYNLLFDAAERGWVYVWPTVGAKVHHNVLVADKASQYYPVAGGFVMVGSSATDPPNTQIYNNTLDAGGVCNPGINAGVVLGSPLSSLRSNAFLDVRLNSMGGTALVGPGARSLESPAPALLGYTDYNLFDSTDATVKANYVAEIPGKAMRTDPGFGLHDVPAGGAANAQVDPKLANQVPRTFPFSDDDIVARTTTTCQILAYYRKAYMPAADSPLVDAGDPMEGSGNDIGAVGAGVANALDLFGKLCDPSDTGNPTITADTYKCAAVAIDPGGGGSTGVGGGGGGMPPGTPHGITCVCELGAGQPAPAGFTLAGAFVALALALRRPRKR
jgi:hypothetical protein